MKCAQCSKDVDESMAFAKEHNMCPYCGGALLNSELVTNLTRVLGQIEFSKKANKQASIIDSIVTLLIREFDIGLKGTLKAVNKPRPVSTTAPGSSPSPSIPADANMYEQVFNEGGALFDGTLSALQQGELEGRDDEDLEVLSNPEAANALANNRIERLRAAARQAEKRFQPQIEALEGAGDVGDGPAPITRRS